jgi:hypothetical protein
MVTRSKRVEDTGDHSVNSPKRARRQAPEAHETEEDEFTIDEHELDIMKQVMGIVNFSTTKNKNHSKSDCFGVIKAQTRKTKQMVKPKTGMTK